ncbi:hypothetical protein [uncultured Sphingomonas sp.]|uniref:hypothetical protein n=1 Tax=uncultured Sphingomonas sp. TaxID=158754 RepID=UPI0025E7E15D|nr:hypothetical protein [uncultured Sphingomonas sp.]
MAVTFLKPTQQGTLYNEGETASFDKETEKRLVDQGFAKATKAGKGDEPETPAA